MISAVRWLRSAILVAEGLSSVLTTSLGEINALSFQERQETTNLMTNIAYENVIPNVLIEVEQSN